MHGMTKKRLKIRPLPLNTILKVNGVSFHQAAVRTVVEYDEVRITHIRDHPYDPYACAVTTMDGRLLGFIPRDLNARLAVPHPGGVWRGKIETVYRNKTWGLRVRVCELLSQGPQDYGATRPGLRHRSDGVIEAEHGVVAVTPVEVDEDSVAVEENDEEVVQVVARSGRLLGELLQRDGNTVRVLTEAGRVAHYPLAVVDLVDTEPVLTGGSAR